MAIMAAVEGTCHLHLSLSRIKASSTRKPIPILESIKIAKLLRERNGILPVTVEIAKVVISY